MNRKSNSQADEGESWESPGRLPIASALAAILGQEFYNFLLFV